MIPTAAFRIQRWILILGLLGLPLLAAAETVRVATFNLYNYLSMDRRVDNAWRPDYPKPEEEKAALRSLIRTIAPQVLAVQEIGSWVHLHELQRDLRSEGIDYPHLALIEAADPTRHTAVLSQLAFTAVIQEDSLTFPYFGEDEHVKRGLLEVTLTTQGVRWSVFNVHLKSRLSNRSDDPQSRRRRHGEAQTVAGHINHKYPADSQPYFLILGDFNDTPADRTLSLLTETENRAFAHRVPCFDSRGETWTYHYFKKEAYYCLDGIIASPALLPYVDQGRGHIADELQGSDHRMVYIDLVFEPD